MKEFFSFLYFIYIAHLPCQRSPLVHIIIIKFNLEL